MNIREFAKQIGVSPATVSLTLSGGGRISAETRKMVMEKMPELGYVPNFNARRLGVGRSFTITLASEGYGGFEDPYILELMRQIGIQLREYGYDLMLNFAADRVQEHLLLLRQVKSRAVDGSVLLYGDRMPRDLLAEIANRDQPAVVVSYSPIEGVPHVGSVVLDLRTGVQQVVRLLVDNGHHRLGFIDSGPQDEVIQYFREETRALGVSLMDENVVVLNPSAASGAQGLETLMTKPSPPTAVFTRTDLLALGAVYQAGRLGLRIPEDFSLVGHDDLSLLQLPQPSLTTVRADLVSLGNLATEMLLQMLNDPKAKPQVKLVSSELVLRDTVGPAPN